MYTAFRKIATLAILLSVAPVLAQEHNVSVPETSPFITYTGRGTGDAPICKLDPNGNLASSQPGCYFIPDQCTSSVAISQNQDHKASASFQFNGSAIYISSLLSDVSPIFTVTLDGSATDVDGVRPSRNFTCATLFSKTGLDPTVQHNITLAVRGPSGNRNMTQDPNGTQGVFSLIEFVFTDPGTSNSTNSNTTSSSVSQNTSSRTFAAPTTPGTGLPKAFDGAAALARPSILLSGFLALAAWAGVGAIAL